MYETPYEKAQSIAEKFVQHLRFVNREITVRRYIEAKHGKGESIDRNKACQIVREYKRSALKDILREIIEKEFNLSDDDINDSETVQGEPARQFEVKLDEVISLVEGKSEQNA